ncbi:Ger(x)C family spore germination protein [Clostridium rectalis]|uniref:Ger(x)C family spore germination protein n=1 Tax=Clostridium rectalis TaxID=2040295 RepID=UPI0013DE3FB3|nr:Ger(x)C family spore germination protein [Clostridium rectalis]
MKKKIISIFICLCMFLNGCYNYNDINKVLFVTTVALDVDANNEPIMYVETFKPYRSSTAGSEKGEKIIYKGEAKTLLENFRSMGQSASYKLNGTQNKAIIFSEKAAEYGIDNFIDLFDRDQEFLVREYVAVYEGDIENLFKLKIKSEEYIGIFLVDLLDNIGTASRSIRLSMNDYLNKRIEPGKTCVMTVINSDCTQMEDMIRINGGAIIKNSKMVDRLPELDSQGYNFLMNNVESGTLEVTNPEDDNKFVTLEILKSKTKSKLYFDEDVLKLKKIINVKATFAEAQKSITLTNKQEVEKISQGAEKNIVISCKDVFDKYKNKNLDIFEVESEFNRKYPHKSYKNILKNTELEIEVNVSVEGSSNKFNFTE